MTSNRSTAARIILIIALTIAAFIALSILLILLDANEGNVIINAIIEVGRFFSTPFHEMFPQSSTDRSVLINWGLGAIAYVLLGGLVIRFLR